MSLKGTADFLNSFNSWHNSSRLLLLLCALLLQSCATNFTEKGQVPGKVLTIKSLGFRETANDISLKEVDPYTVRVTNNLCKTELLSIEHQALLETKSGTQTLDCADAYATYIAHNITAFGVPLLYDSVTGFNLFKKRCRENPPVYLIVTTAETADIIKNEAYDSNTTACKELPVADILLTAKINDAVVYIATSADGIASLPPEKISQLERAAVNTSITYRYEANELVTRHLRKEPENAPQFSIFAMSSPGTDNVPDRKNESLPAENSGPAIALEKGFVAALTPSAPDPVTPPNIIQSNIESAPAAARADSGEKMMAKGGREAVGEMRLPAAPAPVAVAAERPGKMSVSDSKTAPVPEKTAVAEAPAAAKVERESAGRISSPPAILPESAAPGPVAEKSGGAGKAAPAPEKSAAAETPAMVQRDQESTRKSSSPKLVTKGESAPKAGRPLRDEIKSAAPAPVPPRTLLPAMDGSKTKTEPAAKEVILQQILIMSFEPSGLCCPLTEKLFWNIGK